MAEEKQEETQKSKSVQQESKQEKPVQEKSKQEQSEKPSSMKDTKKEKPTEMTPKKTEAEVNGRDLRISTKVAVAICNFIKNKNIDEAIAELQQVTKLKKPIPMKGELPHRKGKIMSGKYPIKAAEVFIRLLNSLKSNAIANELELEKCKLVCKANKASRPYRRFGRTRFKRSHVEIKLIPLEKKVNEMNNKNKRNKNENKYY